MSAKIDDTQYNQPRGRNEKSMEDLIAEQKRELVYLLQNASWEIKELRNAKEHQGLRLKMFDDCMKLLNSQTMGQCVGMGEDLVSRIGKTLKKLNDESKPQQGE